MKMREVCLILFTIILFMSYLAWDHRGTYPERTYVVRISGEEITVINDDCDAQKYGDNLFAIHCKRIKRPTYVK